MSVTACYFAARTARALGLLAGAPRSTTEIADALAIHSAEAANSWSSTEGPPSSRGEGAGSATDAGSVSVLTRPQRRQARRSVRAPGRVRFVG